MATHFLLPDEARLIVRNFLEHHIHPLMMLNGLKRKQIHVTVAYRQTGVTFEDSVLCQVGLNVAGGEFEYPFDEYSERKCRLAHREGMSTREILAMHPTLIRTGDCALAGGIVLYDFAVGVSGVDNWDDEAFGVQIAAELWRVQMGRLEEIRPQDIDYFGDEIKAT